MMIVRLICAKLLNMRKCDKFSGALGTSWHPHFEVKKIMLIIKEHGEISISLGITVGNGSVPKPRDVLLDSCAIRQSFFNTKYNDYI